MMYIHKADGSCCPQEETADEMFGLCGTEDDEAKRDGKVLYTIAAGLTLLAVALLFGTIVWAMVTE
jgi:hypothetical protein